MISLKKLEVTKGRKFSHSFGHLSKFPFVIHVDHSHTKPLLFRYSLTYTLRHLPNFNLTHYSEVFLQFQDSFVRWKSDAKYSVHKRTQSCEQSLALIGYLHDTVTLLLRPESFSLFFHIKIWLSKRGLNNKSLNLHKREKPWRILVVVVKWRHRANNLLARATGPRLIRTVLLDCFGGRLLTQFSAQPRNSQTTKRLRL